MLAKVGIDWKVELMAPVALRNADAEQAITNSPRGAGPDL